MFTSRTDHDLSGSDMTLTTFTYRALVRDDADPWQALRLEGARDFPMGFLVTVAETAAATPERCRAILDAGTMRGVFDDDLLVGFCGYRPNSLERIRHRAEIGPFSSQPPFTGRVLQMC